MDHPSLPTPNHPSHLSMNANNATTTPTNPQTTTAQSQASKSYVSNSQTLDEIMKKANEIIRRSRNACQNKPDDIARPAAVTQSIPTECSQQLRGNSSPSESKMQTCFLTSKQNTNTVAETRSSLSIDHMNNHIRTPAIASTTTTTTTSSPTRTNTQRNSTHATTGRSSALLPNDDNRTLADLFFENFHNNIRIRFTNSQSYSNPRSTSCNPTTATQQQYQPHRSNDSDTNCATRSLLSCFERVRYEEHVQQSSASTPSKYLIPKAFQQTTSFDMHPAQPSLNNSIAEGIEHSMQQPFYSKSITQSTKVSTILQHPPLPPRHSQHSTATTTNNNTNNAHNNHNNAFTNHFNQNNNNNNMHSSQQRYSSNDSSAYNHTNNKENNSEAVNQSHHHQQQPMLPLPIKPLTIANSILLSGSLTNTPHNSHTAGSILIPLPPLSHFNQHNNNNNTTSSVNQSNGFSNSFGRPRADTFSQSNNTKTSVPAITHIAAAGGITQLQHAADSSLRSSGTGGLQQRSRASSLQSHTQNTPQLNEGIQFERSFGIRGLTPTSQGITSPMVFSTKNSTAVAAAAAASHQIPMSQMLATRQTTPISLLNSVLGSTKARDHSSSSNNNSITNHGNYGAGYHIPQIRSNSGNRFPKVNE